MENYDHVIIGAGIYGLYVTLELAKKKRKIIVIEMEPEGFLRATLVNQTRVHNGYHYPRSLSTAVKSADYFNRFAENFNFAINNKYTNYYSISKRYSYTSAEQFKTFCTNAGIPCKEINLEKILSSDTIEASFQTEEYAFDALKIKKYFLSELKKYPNVVFRYNSLITSATKDDHKYTLELNSGHNLTTRSVINTTYASTNQIAKLFDLEGFNLKYEICEIIRCNVSDNLKNIGITVMDGPFFSLMPFGLDNCHSLTSVTFTPHKTSDLSLPTFDCQKLNKKCSPLCLQNCNSCPVRPKSAFPYMKQLALKYLINTKIDYLNSYFAIKPILKESEVDDSRPTIVRSLSKNPQFISILSGKINTIYDLSEVLESI